MQRYALRSLRLPVGSGFLSLVIPDSDAWIREGAWVEDAQRGAEPPYWVQIWPAAVALARLLARRGSLEGLRVLDLGCGIGVPGAAASRAGAEVTFADREADALAFAVWNARRCSPSGRSPQSQQLDWGHQVVEGRFDVVLLADVSYRPLHHRPLRRQLAACLADDGVVLHADPFRRESREFLSGMRADFAVAEGLLETSFQDKRVPIRVFGASKSPAALDAWRPLLARPANHRDAGKAATEHAKTDASPIRAVEP